MSIVYKGCIDLKPTALLPITIDGTYSVFVGRRCGCLPRPDAAMMEICRKAVQGGLKHAIDHAESRERARETIPADEGLQLWGAGSHSSYLIERLDVRKIHCCQGILSRDGFCSNPRAPCGLGAAASKSVRKKRFRHVAPSLARCAFQLPSYFEALLVHHAGLHCRSRHL